VVPSSPPPSHLPNIPGDKSHLSDAPDDESRPSNPLNDDLSGVADIEMDDSEFLITVNDDALAVATPPTQSEVEVRFLPRLGVSALVESEPPALLSVDGDVRPHWLLTVTKKFLPNVPYFACLGKVIDLFLDQEARLGYPTVVGVLPFTLFGSLIHILKSKHAALTCVNRPVEVGQFQKWHRDPERGYFVDAEKFGNSVIKWWLTIQPTTRKQWPPVHISPPKMFSFDYFNRGGPNGAFLVILCLGWWANALDVDKNVDDYTIVVNDVRWVLEQIASRA